MLRMFRQYYICNHGFLFKISFVVFIVLHFQSLRAKPFVYIFENNLATVGTTCMGKDSIK